MSPKTVKTVWIRQFHACVAEVLERCKPLGKADMVKDIAMPIAAEALKSMTGLSNMDWREMDRVSQGMIDGCANYDKYFLSYAGHCKINEAPPILEGR